MAEDLNEEWDSHINRQLKLSSRSRAYACVKVLILYWEESDDGFKSEGRALGELFQNRELFNFAVEEFAIPTSNSYLQLHNFVTKALLDLSSWADEKRGASLLIIHYGGHSDRNDDRHAGEEKKSVWAAHREGEPTLEWFRIQEDLMTTESHMLLLFDCCFAAQAGRAHQKRPTRIELLAAAAMGVETPMPGNKSFTMALVRELDAGFKKEQRILVSDLHRRLVSREAELWATPFYVKLGREQSSISLERLADSTSPSFSSDSKGSSFQLLINIQAQLDKANLDEIARWLGENTPSTVTTLHVAKVIETTTTIQNLVEEVRHGNPPLTQGIQEPVIDNVLQAWDEATIILKRVLKEQIGVDRQYRNLPTIQTLAGRLLDQLNTENSLFVGLLEQKLLESPTLAEGAATSAVATTLGIADQLKLRQIIIRPETPTTDSYQNFPREGSLAHLPIMQEYKEYGPYINPAEIPTLTRRVKRLAELLNASKNSEYLTLRCIGWSHKKIEQRYVLDFEIPSRYKDGGGIYTSLQSIIQDSRGTARPSLEEKFKMAYLLAVAVRNWHSVGWLHQSISSPNVIFFELTTRKVDFSNPFLGGFEFARPDSDPSMGYAADDIAFNVYRHPARQGEERKGHRKIHDIYSLGVVLLEIGLWQSAFEIVTPRERKHQRGPISAALMQQKLQVAASERLPHYAGRSYQTAVEACLGSGLYTDWDVKNESQLASAFRNEVIESLVRGISIR